MMNVPLSGVPSQTLQIVLDGQNCQISVYTKNGYDYSDPTFQTTASYICFDLTVNGVVITTTQNCLDGARLLLNRQYFGFVGDFMFIDTQGDEDPQYVGLGSRWLLLYLEADDLATLAADLMAVA
jgi:hypothetical protein